MRTFLAKKSTYLSFSIDNISSFQENTLSPFLKERAFGRETLHKQLSEYLRRSSLGKAPRKKEK